MAATQKKPYTKKTDEEIYEATTNKILSLMESGKLPWQKGWDGKVGASIFHVPINGKSGRPYGSPLNSLYLSCIMAEKESDDPRFFSIGVLKQQNKIHKERVEKYRAEGKEIPRELLWEYRTKEGAKPTTVGTSRRINTATSCQRMSNTGQRNTLRSTMLRTVCAVNTTGTPREIACMERTASRSIPIIP